MIDCNNCIKEMNTRNCKNCSANPVKYIVSVSVICDKSCSQYSDREWLGCKPVTGDCARADRVVTVLTAMGVLKE
ncbi:MAG: hypothetical protein WC365_05355 [Candidatus Babeliales bacterium]